MADGSAMLNNTGDEVWLVSPSAAEGPHLTYTSAQARSGTSSCWRLPTDWHSTGGRAPAAHRMGRIMMRRGLLIVSLLGIGCVTPWEPDTFTVKTEHHPNGRLALRQEVAFRRHPGTFPHGLSQRWHDNEQLAEEGTYRFQKKHGRWWRYHRNGQLRDDWVYHDGEPADGIYVEWYENGRKFREGSYADGLRQGVWITWDLVGHERGRVEYVEGVPADGRYTEWHITGHKALEGRRRDGKRQGWERSWWLNGRPKRESHYVDDWVDGPVRSWYSNGKLQTAGRYRNNLQVGFWTHYDRAGHIWFTAEHWDGQRVVR